MKERTVSLSYREQNQGPKGTGNPAGSDFWSAPALRQHTHTHTLATTKPGCWLSRPLILAADPWAPNWQPSCIPGPVWNRRKKRWLITVMSVTAERRTRGEGLRGKWSYTQDADSCCCCCCCPGRRVAGVCAHVSVAFRWRYGCSDWIWVRKMEAVALEQFVRISVELTRSLGLHEIKSQGSGRRRVLVPYWWTCLLCWPVHWYQPAPPLPRPSSPLNTYHSVFFCPCECHYSILFYICNWIILSIYWKSGCPMYSTNH